MAALLSPVALTRAVVLCLAGFTLANPGEAGAQEPAGLNPIEVKPEVAALGKRLFYDTRLSGDTTLSCASCHQPDKAFTDGEALSAAYSGAAHFRNTPTLANVGHRSAWMHDGRLGTNLNDVTREMITETYLMNMDMRIMQERLKQDPVYVEMFKAAGKGEPSNGGARSAIQAFVQTITSNGAPIDSGTLSAGAQRGQGLFEGKAGCAACHSGTRFTDDKPYNTGVPDNPEIWADPERHSAFVTYAKFMGVENYMNIRDDLGAYVRTHNPDMAGSFLTPTLRELTWTAPYMHNGVFETLDEVVDFYDAGAGDDPRKDQRLKPLGLIPSEKADLIEFLKALSGESFDTDRYVWRDEDYGYTTIEDWRDVPN
ncbi:MAG: cytochrome c peroxidase [Pseudomonadota bacterium]